MRKKDAQPIFFGACAVVSCRSVGRRGEKFALFRSLNSRCNSSPWRKCRQRPFSLPFLYPPLPCITRRLAFLSLFFFLSPARPFMGIQISIRGRSGKQYVRSCDFYGVFGICGPTSFFLPPLGSGHKNRAVRIERRRWRPVKIVRFCATLYIFGPTLRHRTRTTFAFIIRTDIHRHSLKKFRAPF